MNCRKYQDKLALLALGDLPRAERETLEAHIKDCPACRSEYESLCEVVSLYSPQPEDKLTAIDKLTLENNVLHQLLKDRQSRKMRARPRTLTYLLRLAAAILIFFAGYAAPAFMTQTISPRQATIGVGEKILAGQQNRALVSGLRFSADGLKVIARGKSALEINP